MYSYKRLTQKTNAGYMCDADLRTVVQRLGELEDKIEGSYITEEYRHSSTIYDRDGNNAQGELT